MVVPPKRKRALVSSGLTMKIQWKAAFMERYAQNQRNRKRGALGRDPTLLELQRRIRKIQRSERRIKEEPVLTEVLAGDPLHDAGMEALTPSLDEVRVKQEPLETDTVSTLWAGRVVLDIIQKKNQGCQFSDCSLISDFLRIKKTCIKLIKSGQNNPTLITGRECRL